MSKMVIASKYRLPRLDGEVLTDESRRVLCENHKDVPVEADMVETVNLTSDDSGIMWVVDEKKTAAYLKLREKRIAEKAEIKAQKAEAKKGTINAIAEAVSQANKKKEDEKPKSTTAKAAEKPEK